MGHACPAGCSRCTTGRCKLGGISVAPPTVATFAGARVVLASRLGRDPDLIALDPETGAELWSVAGLGAHRARPLVVDRDGDGAAELVVATDRSGLVALDERRAVRWRYRPRSAGATRCASRRSTPNR